MRPVRLELLTEIPAPYRIPLFNALAGRDDIDLEVLFLRDANPERPYRLHADEWEFASHVLPGRDVTLRGRWLVLNTGVGRAFLRRNPDVLLLGGWNQPAFWRAAIWARRRKRPVVVWVESTLADDRNGDGRLKRLLASAAAAFVVPGTAAAAYVRSLAPEARVVVAPNNVDAALYASRLPERNELRASLGLERATILYVGRLAWEKGVDLLLEAAAGLDADVLVAGVGPEEPRLRAAAPSNVRFLGFVDRDDLPGWYAAADVLCLPSRSEPWGFPLNEGAAAGLPLVATDRVGAAWDLIDHGANGFRVRADDHEELRTALRELVGDPELRRRAGARSSELSRRFTADAWVEEVAGLTASLASG